MLKINNITKIEEANLFLQTYITKFNEKFALPHVNFTSVFENTANKSKINQVLAVIETRKIDNGCSINKYHNEIYQPYENNKIVPLRNKTEILVINTFENQLLLSHNEKVYELVRLESHMKTSSNFDPGESVEQKPLK